MVKSQYDIKSINIRPSNITYCLTGNKGKDLKDTL